MSLFGLGRRAPAIGLLVGGAIALIGCQRITPVTTVSAPVAPVSSVALQRVVAAQPAVPMMAAAQPVGQFEDLYTPAPAPAVAPEPARAPEPEPVIVREPPKVYESGIASTYGEGDGFEGNRTACGQIFHTHEPQIAHKSLPCGTTVRVEDTDTGKSIVAQVTDRGPYVAGRIVDLSWGAFSQLDPTSPGLLHVNVYLVDDERD